MTHPIPTAALDDRLGFVGTSGSGKTYGAGTAVERLLHARARAIIIDPLGVWYGLRLLNDGQTPSGFDVVIFGGPHGDMPINERAGALIGETVATMKESAIIDLSELGAAASERRFMLAFFTALYKHADKEPVHLIIDEADMVAPQRILDREGDAQKLLGIAETIVRRGRVKGFIPWLISQRPAVLNKNVLSQVDGLVGFLLTSSQDRDALGAWVEGQADKGVWAKLYADMATYSQGEALVWLPQQGTLKVGRFPVKEMFDSSRTPKRHEKKIAAVVKPLDVEALRKKLAKVEEEAKASDPKALKAELATLRRQMAEAAKVAASTGTAIDPKAVEEAERRGYDHGYTEGGDRVMRGVANLAPDLAAAVGRAEAACADTRRLLDSFSTFMGALEGDRKMRPQRPPLRPPAPVTPRPIARPARQPTNGHATNTGLGLGERRMLAAIAQTPGGVTREGLTVMTGYKRSSRNTYLQRLTSAGLVEATGERLIVTVAGMDTLGPDFEPLPTGDALREHWLRELPEGEGRVFAEVVRAYPAPVDRETLRDLTGYQRSSCNTYLQRLSARDLVVRSGSGVAAADTLFQ